MTEQVKPVSRSSRRYLRFSVRGLIVLVLVIGAGMGWIVREAHIQRDAVAAIKNAGGVVSYDWEWSNGKSILGGKPRAPKWLVDLIGVDYLSHVTTVRLNTSSASPDAAIAHVGRLTRLQSLDFDGSSIGDAGLAHLKGLSKLSVLRLSGTQVIDAGLAHLSCLTNLSELYLGDTQVSDTGLAHLKGLTQLSIFLLYSTRVTDAGLAHLNGMTNVSVLGLQDTRISDAGLAHLRRLTKLTDLDLGATQVTRAGMDELRHALPDLFIYK